MEVSLKKGEHYKIITPYRNPLGELTYVRREKIPSLGDEEWETFYTVLGGEVLDCSEGLVSFGGVLVRARIPTKSLMGRADRTIISDGELVTKLIQDPENRTPLVESWLREVEEIARSS